MDKKSVMSHMTHNRRTNINSRGLIISAPKEWYFLTGQVDLDNSEPPVIRHPGDPAGQTLGILESLTDMLDREGWSLDDVIRVQLDVTAEVTVPDHGVEPLPGQSYGGEDSERLKEARHLPGLAGIYQVLRDFWKDVDPKPAWGTVRRVSGLGHPDALVEIEFLAAR